MALFVMLHRAGAAWDASLPYFEQPGVMGHIGFMRSLDERGVMILGGPFEDAVAGEAVGMAIVEAPDLAAARALADEDPSSAAGLLTAEVRAWRPRMGRALEG